MNIDDALSAMSVFLSEHVLLRRLFFATLELAVLAPLVMVLIRVARIRSPRVIALLLLVVLVKPVVTLSVGSPLGIGLFEVPVLATEPVEAVAPDPAAEGADAAAPADVVVAPLGVVEVERKPVGTGTFSLLPTSPAPPDGASAPETAVSGEPMVVGATADAPVTEAAKAPIPVAAGDATERVGSPEAPVTAEAGGGQAAGGRGLTLPRIITGLWLIGVAYFVLRYVMARLVLRRLLRGARAADDAVVERYGQVAARLGLSGAPRLLVTDGLESPAIAGVIRPVILMPGYLTERVPDDRFDWAVRHELTHYRWRDTAAIFVRDLAVALFYFHPTVWWAVRRLSESLELACDRAMIREAEEAPQYAEQLYQILQHIRLRQRRPVLAAGLFATRTQVGRRIAALLDVSFVKVPQLTLLSAAAVVLVAAGVLGVGPRFTSATESDESSERADVDAAVEVAEAADDARQFVAMLPRFCLAADLFGACSVARCRV